MTAVVACAFCDTWSVEMRGDDHVEMATFLRARLMEHIKEQHPERLVVIVTPSEGKPS